MNVAVFPARGGSKRIPHKNIKEFNGKPIIAWPLEVAKRSGLFGRILVSTDSEEIAEVSKSYGAEVPFIRPAELADDYTGTTEVIAHTISWLREEQCLVDNACCIYASSVFLTVSDLMRGYHALNTGHWSFSFSVTDFEYPILRSFKEHPEGGVEMLFPEHFEKRSQDLPIALHDATQFYWGKSTAWESGIKLFGRHSYPVKIPHWRVLDIDTEDDWKRAEIMFKVLEREMTDSTDDLRLRDVTVADKGLLLIWANDPEVRKGSFDSHMITEDEHEKWFSRKLDDSNGLMWILEVSGSPAGLVRVDKEDNEVVLSYQIASPYRGRGMGAKMLKMAQRELDSHWEIAKVVAYTLPDNIASIKSLERAGYRLETSNDEKQCYVFQKPQGLT